ncbi:hypothetical protein J8I29_04495 [Labrys sp. LIt4]|uniref:hypothetical protein n=1 Tax=Labrys sp. LIt4 TaxID=2821355 RepID=UPI001ADEEE1F|nr:hypothetical protein [Labrys sp. LIt4]MBP0578561.1 hypothetical protein [Labrys sp. LIt4]
MMDSYLTAGLTRGLSLALSPLVATDDAERMAGGQLREEAGECGEPAKVSNPGRVAGILAMAWSKFNSRPPKKRSTAGFAR